MTFRRILWTVAALVCIALGFVLAQQYERNRSAKEMRALEEQQAAEIERVRSEVDAIARTQGQIVLRAFAAGVSPSVLAGRRESVEIAAVDLLVVPGIAGIHVLGPDGTVIYSSDAKLATTGEGAYRGSWALNATELVSQASSRPNVIDLAIPVLGGGERKAVIWLEYDVAAVKAAAAQPASTLPTGATATSDNESPEQPPQ